MKLVALLSFYSEAPADLERLVDSLPKAGVSTLVALDGKYALYPGTEVSSPKDNHDALHAACRRNGIDLDLTIPTKTFAGNETEKRTTLFRLAEQHTTDRDWFLIVDGDEELRTCPTDLHDTLSATPLNVGEVIFQEQRKGTRNGAISPSAVAEKLGQKVIKAYPIPILFRALRGIHVIGNHYTYRTPDGRNLWGNARHVRLEARVQIHDLVVDHWTRHRGRPRRRAAANYYLARDYAEVEAGRCHTEGCTRRATRVIEGDEWRELCTLHALEDHAPLPAQAA